MSRKSTYIMDLLMTTLSGCRDEFGKDVVPPNGLSFDRVMEGKHIASKSPLIAIPTEILGQIIQYLSSDDLRNLAFVNSDCRQLARSQQFKSVVLGYSPSSSRIVQMLCQEATEREHSAAAATYIGSCIRRLTVATEPAWVEHRHNISMDSIQTLGREVADERLAIATEAFFGVYLLAVEIALSPTSMPHLELLNWEDRAVLQPSLFMAMVASTIQHLRLARVMVDQEFEIRLPDHSKLDSWPLRSLHLELFPALSAKMVSLRSLTMSILSLCAPTLEILKWKGSPLSSGDSYSFASLRSTISFPSLRRLTLNMINLSDSSVLSALLGPITKVRELETNIESGAVVKDFFAGRGNIQTLETLCSPLLESLDFLRANPQLSKLMMKRPISPDSPVTQLLSESFHGLSSLSLAWKGVTIPNLALEQISTLHSLCQLQISTGEQFGWRHDWFVDHGTIRSHFCKLKNLRKLALSRDTYRTTTDSGFDRDYYHGLSLLPRDDNEQTVWDSIMHQSDTYFADRERSPNEEFDAPNRWLERAFTKVHSMRMQEEASKYAGSVPSLDWIYVGKLPFAISKDRRVITLSDELDECWTFLQRMFGLPNSGD